MKTSIGESINRHLRGASRPMSASEIGSWLAPQRSALAVTRGINAMHRAGGGPIRWTHPETGVVCYVHACNAEALGVYAQMWPSRKRRPDDRIMAALRNATAPMTARAIADQLGDTTAVSVRRAIDRLRKRGIGVVNWPGLAGGYIARHREDLLYVTVGSVIAECDALAARKAMH